LAAPGTITGSKAATEILPDVQMMAHRLSEWCILFTLCFPLGRRHRTWEEVNLSRFV
jgi:hypothetical protein